MIPPLDPRLLPEGYELYRTIDPAEDRRLARRLSALSLIVALGMAAAALPFVPLSAFLRFHAPSVFAAVRLLLLLPAILAASAVHEGIRWLILRRFGRAQPAFRRVGIYIYAESPALFRRRPFLLSIFVPVILLGALYLFLHAVLPISWFWFAYILQIVNISGAAGDFCLSVILSRLPASLLIRSCGGAVELYLPGEKDENV